MRLWLVCPSIAALVIIKTVGAMSTDSFIRISSASLSIFDYNAWLCSPNLEDKIMSTTPAPNNRTKKGVYLLPNLFTTAGLFLGFYAIVAAMQGKFETASIAIFIAMIADGLDGRVARLTNTESAFGAQYDSLSDMITFGLAPALLVFTWSLSTLGKIGWLCAFLYVAGTALRLARFNSQLENDDKHYFTGLACPAAAGLLVGFIWYMDEMSFDVGSLLVHASAAITVALGALQVSNLKYYSFKVFDFKSHVPFTVLIAVVVLVAAIAMDPAAVLFYGFALYVVLGPLTALKRQK